MGCDAHRGQDRPVAPRAGARIETSSQSQIGSRAASPPVRGRGSKRLQCLEGTRQRRRPPCGGADRNVIMTSTLANLVGRPPCGGADRNVALWLRADRRACRPPCGGADRNVALWLRADRRASSPPVRGRGSKHRDQAGSARAQHVAPRAGARIETTNHYADPIHKEVVAPRAGARIETWPILEISVVPGRVAPRAGARIETAFSSTPTRRTPTSPPVRGRGSKQWRCSRLSAVRCRPPCGGADRNMHTLHDHHNRARVAPRAGARIETCGIKS